MEETVYLLDLFSRYQPEQPLREAFAGARIRHAQIDSTARRVAVEFWSDRYLPRRQREAFANGASRVYGMGHVALHPRFPREQLGDAAFADLTDAVVSEFSMAAATLAGARWEVEGDTIVIHLRANGKAELEEHLHCAVQAVENQFGFRPAFRVEAGNATDGEQLYAQT